MIQPAFSKLVGTVLTVAFTSPQRKIKPQPGAGGGGGESKSITEKGGQFLGQRFKKKITFFDESTGQLQSSWGLFLKV